MAVAIENVRRMIAARRRAVRLLKGSPIRGRR
jgi:hypothetical protein